MPFLRNGCRQLGGNFQRSAQKFAQTAEFQLGCAAVDADASARSNAHCRRDRSSAADLRRSADIATQAKRSARPECNPSCVFMRSDRLSDRNRAASGRNLPLPTRHAML